MLHIGDKDINLAVQGAGVLYIGSRKMGPIINESSEPTPSETILHQYDRVDGKATVAGFWTDGNGQRYAVCVADAAYRSTSKRWSDSEVDTLLPNYNSTSAVLAAGESATYNTDTILNNYYSKNYPAFDAARNYSTTIIVDGKTFEGQLPNVAEIQMIYDYKSTLDNYDITLPNYPNVSLNDWKFGGSDGWSGAISSNELNQSYCWFRTKTYYWQAQGKPYYYLGVIPVFEIPVDENGKVITN